MNPDAAQTYREVMVAEPPAVDSPLQQAALDFVFGDVWSRPGLGRRERRLVTLASVGAADAAGPRTDHVYAALASGDLTLEELGEVTLHFAVYSGWPKASEFESTVRSQWARVHRERGEDVPPWPMLSNDTLGPAAFEERLSKGEQHFLDVNFWPAPSRDSPYYHAGILNFVFGHVWQRPNLSQRDRRFVTLACVGASDAPGPIMSHIYSALRSRDLTYEEMQEVVLQFSAYSGFAKGEVMNRVAVEQWARAEHELEAR